MPIKRHFRKIKRQAHNGFSPHPVRFTRWNWFDWFAFIIAIIFVLWALVSIILHSTHMYNTYHAKVNATKNNKHEVEITIQINSHVKPGKSICGGFIIINFMLILCMLIVFVWLRIFRNLCFFILVVIALIIVIVFYIILGLSALHLLLNDDAYVTDVHKYVTDRLTPEKHGDADYFYFQLDDLQHDLNCCGMNDQYDWKQWNAITVINAGEFSVPNSCCKNQTDEMYFACDNKEILKQAPNEENFESIFYKKGCAKELKATMNSSFILFIIEAFVMAFLLIVYLILLLFMAHQLYKKIARPNWELEYNPREQEDDLESDIIPGTPAKSMMDSLSEYTTFYAPSLDL